MSTVFAHNLTTDSWIGGFPAIKKPRSSAGACLVADHVYIVAGRARNEDDSMLNCIEKIHVESLIPDGAAEWTLIQIPQKVFGPRTNCGVARLNDTEFVILGGDGPGSGENIRCGIFVFDTRTETIKLVGDNKFQGYSRSN